MSNRFESRITRLLAGRAQDVFICILALACVVVRFFMEPVQPLTTDSGLIFTSPEMWGLTGVISLGANLAGVLVVLLLMCLLNSQCGLVKSSSSVLFMPMLAIMLCSTSWISAQFNGGTILAIAVLLALLMLSTTYMDKNSTRVVFMAFLLMSCAAMVQYGMVPFIVAMLVVVLPQMRCASTRPILAALLGILTPLWLLWAFGCFSFSEIQWPERVDVFTIWPHELSLGVIMSVGVTLVAGLILGLANLMHVINYNAKSRAFNGMLVVIGTLSGIMVLVDYRNVVSYLTLLYAATSLQTAIFFNININRRGYLPVLILMTAYMALYVWGLGII